MTTTTTDTAVFRIFIKAPIDKVWAYIVDPEFNGSYAYGAPAYYDLVPGGKYEVPSTAEMLEFGAPPIMCDGEVVEVDAPNRLVQKWAAYFTPESIAEGARTVTWELEETDGVTKVTLTHDVVDAPATLVFVTGSGDGGSTGDGGGWPLILSDMKTVIETGASFAA